MVPTYNHCSSTAGGTGNSSGVWLGRPRHPGSSTQYIRSGAVYVNGNLGARIARDGWARMGNPRRGRQLIPAAAEHR